MTHAGEQSSLSIKIGAKGGMSWVKWYRSGPTIENASQLLYLPSFSSGIHGSLGWKVGPQLNVGFQPELAFVRRGTDTEIDGDKGPEFTMNYIEMPIFARVEFQISERVHPFVMVGSRLGILQGVRFQDPDGNTGELSGYARTDFGLSASIGAGFSVSKRFDITVEGRYDVGFVDLATDNEDVDIRNQGISLLLGVNWNLLGDEQ